MSTNQKIAAVAVIVATGIAGFLAGQSLNNNSTQTENPVHEAEVQEMKEFRNSEGFRFINPLLECDNYQPSHINSVVNMENDVRGYIDQAQAQKKASFVSVYYRDLNFGPWMGINEKENFSPASLLKVPIMIAALKKAEGEPGFLNKKVAYAQHLDKNAVPNITDPNLLKIGSAYTIEQLIERMIEYSDNEAKELLLRNIGEQFILKVMVDIGINVNTNMAADFVSVKDYSGFFRLLYNATYLNRDMSEKALKILSKTSFDRGIIAGLPKGLVVSHKFGERAYLDTDIKQLHECGIVYNNGNPYLVCIMTRGTDFSQLASVLSDVSAIIYRNVTINPK